LPNRKDQMKEADGGTSQGVVPTGHSFTGLPTAFANMVRTFSDALPEYEVLLETIAREVSTLTGDACNLRMLSPDGLSLRAIVPRDAAPAFRDALLATVLATAPISEWGPWRSVIDERRVLRFAPARPPVALSPMQVEFVRQFDLRHTMLVPLIARGHVIGGIALHRLGRDVAYTAADEAFLIDLADRAAFVIDNSRLLLAEKTARTDAERELADRVRAEQGLERAHQRLQHLYEIGKVFASFDSVEQPFDPALGIVARTLPLRSAILVETHDDRTRMIVWPSEGQSSEQMAAVKDHMQAAYKYLVGAPSTEALHLSEQAGMTTLPKQGENQEGLANRFIVIPLVVARRPPFGALQLEGAQPLDKADLIFVNAIANQLAIALDRERAWRRDITMREHAEEGRTHAEEGRTHAEERRTDAEDRRVTADRGRVIAEHSREKYETLAADNARLYEQAQLAVRAREQILAVVSHDLKNPLGAILMTTDALAKRGVVEERRRGYAQAFGRIQRSAERMLRLIEDLLDFASIETGHLAIKRRPQDPGPMIQETLTSFEGVALDKGQQLTADLQPGLPKVYCDRDRILQVFSNLVGNATKATPGGGSITLRAEARDHDLLFSIADTGPGISEEDATHLFERYWRADEVEYKGTGLGLAIAKGIVNAHGGRIWAESELGQGATFFFTVPTADVTLLFTVPAAEAALARGLIETRPAKET
jgi:signal transduction histidine kinase